MTFTKRVVSLLTDVRPTDYGGTARCPVHIDQPESVRITIDKDPEGLTRVTFKCVAGCVGREFRNALRARASRSPIPEDAMYGLAPESDIACRPAPTNASVSVRKRTRGCLECGTEFQVNVRHAETHRFCRPACRARHHRRRQKPRPTSTEESSMTKTSLSIAHRGEAMNAGTDGRERQKPRLEAAE